ncbi:MAG: hypothetical protein ACI4V1_10565 [Eubacteriales bacterium]
MNFPSIDRRALVTRHTITLSGSRKVIPLGNGEFCFSADRTGLQTFGGNSMAHWAWHEFPLPDSVRPEDLPETGTYMHGRLTGDGRDLVPAGKEDAARYMFDNPHSFSLGRLRFTSADGADLPESAFTDAVSVCDLWNGILHTTFRLDGRPVRVTTCVHPEQDAAAVKIEADASVGLAVTLDFAYPTLTNGAWLGDFSVPDRHATDFTCTESSCHIRRTLDKTSFSADWQWTNGTLAAPAPHTFLLTFCGGTEFVLRYNKEDKDGAAPQTMPTEDEAETECAAAWNAFWESGGAIDLSGSRDERWFELERRIVLSQYILRVQSAGSWPSAEAGLMYTDNWRGQFHMEMVWWHAAHYALWQRMELADRQLGCYRTFLPMAKKLAADLDCRGAKWGKSVNPNGRTAPWQGNLALLWKQPHPIFFAELEYKNRPTSETLEKWAEIIDETAWHMADVAVKKEDGFYHLDPVMPPSELGFTHDTLFDLAYWKWGLDMAQTWRERMGKARVPAWDEVSENLAPLPVKDGLYLRAPDWTETYEKQNYEHPDPVGVYGMLPPTEMVSRRIARNSLKKVWECWDKNRIWGWDFPWIAMCASRVNEPDIAVEAMLSLDVDEIGASGRGSYPYLPANGAVLYAAAMMAVGANGETAPGFPKDGRWVVRAEKILPW